MGGSTYVLLDCGIIAGDIRGSSKVLPCKKMYLCRGGYFQVAAKEAVSGLFSSATSPFHSKVYCITHHCFREAARRCALQKYIGQSARCPHFACPAGFICQGGFLHETPKIIYFLLPAFPERANHLTGI